MKKTIIWTLVFMVLISQCYAIGLVPSSKIIDFESGKTIPLRFKILNTEHESFRALVYAEGEFSDLITIKNPELKVESKQDSEFVFYNLNIPENLPPGSHKIKIIVHKIPENTKSTVSVSLKLVHQVVINVPYPGNYAKAKLYIPSIEPNKSAKIAVEVINLGTDSITSAQAFIDIYSLNNTKLKTLESDIKEIKVDKKEFLFADWIPTLSPGVYHAVATVIYDDNSTFDKTNFNIGSLLIDIISVEVNNFILGQIARFEIFLESLWNTKTEDVFIEMIIFDEQSNIRGTYTSAQSSLEPFSKKKIFTYWNTEDIAIGKYFTKIKIHYNQQFFEETFDLVVSQNKISTNFVGNVIISEDKKVVNTPIIILIILILVHLLFNIYKYLKK